MSKWVIIGREKCKWCDEAKKLMSSHGIHYTYLDIKQFDGLLAFLTLSGLNTVPQVFYNGVNIGGYSDLKRTMEPDDDLD